MFPYNFKGKQNEEIVYRVLEWSKLRYGKSILAKELHRNMMVILENKFRFIRYSLYNV